MEEGYCEFICLPSVFLVTVDHNDHYIQAKEELESYDDNNAFLNFCIILNKKFCLRAIPGHTH